MRAVLIGSLGVVLLVSCSSKPTSAPEPTPLPTPSGAAQWPAQQTQVEHFALTFDPNDMPRLEDPSTARDYIPGRLTVRGVEYAVGVRLRGDQARYHPKLSWKVKMAEGETFDGMRRLNFLAEWLDGGYLTDVFAYELMRASGAWAPYSRYVTLSVNGRDEGVFVLLDEVDKHFLKEREIDTRANIYRCGARDCELKLTPPAHYQKPWQKENHEEEPWDDLHALLWQLSRTPEHEMEGFLREHLDLEAYLRYLAASVLISIHGIDDSGSYLVHDRQMGRWLYVPWDLNNSMLLLWRTDPVGARPRVDRPIPVYTAYDPIGEKLFTYKETKFGGAHMPFSVLNQRIWDIPSLRNRVLDLLEELTRTVFTDEVAWPRIEGQYALIQELLPKDPYVELAVARYAPEYLKKYVTGRRAFLEAQIPLERRRGEGGVVINSFGIPPGAVVDAQGEAVGYIELYNREAVPVELGGMSFSNDLRRQFLHMFPAGLVIPAHGTLRLTADGRADAGPTHLPFKLQTQGGELGLFDGKRMSGAVDLTFHAPLSPGKAYGRGPQGAESWGWQEAR